MTRCVVRAWSRPRLTGLLIAPRHPPPGSDSTSDTRITPWPGVFARRTNPGICPHIVFQAMSDHNMLLAGEEGFEPSTF